MTYEELKEEAKKLGYNLIKVNQRPKIKPCVCGCKARKHLVRIYYDNHKQETLRILECHWCERRVEAKTEIETINKWNEMIENEKEFIKEMES